MTRRGAAFLARFFGLLLVVIGSWSSVASGATDGPLLDLDSCPLESAEGADLNRAQVPFQPQPTKPAYKGPIKVHIAETAPAGTTRQAIENGLAAWASKTNVRFDVVYSDVPPTEGVKIDWVNANSAPDEVAKADFTPGATGTRTVTIYKKDSGGTDYSATAIQNAVTHEVGHTIALGHDDGTDANSIMVGNAKCWKNDGAAISYRTTLKKVTASDVAAVNKLYPPPKPPAAPKVTPKMKRKK